MEPWLVYLLSIAVLTAVVMLAILFWRLSRTASEAERLISRLNQMCPQVERLLAEAESELAEVRKVTQKVNGIADQVGSITQKAAGLAIPALETAGALAKPLRYVSAAVAGAQAMMQFFKSRRNHEPGEAEVPAVEPSTSQHTEV